MSAAAGRRAERFALWRKSAAIGGLLLVLLAATLALAYVPMGVLNGPVTWGIAVAKMLLVVVVFMKLGRAPALLRLAALAGAFWLLTLFAMTLTDYPFRQTGEQGRSFPEAAPADAPPTIDARSPDP